MNEPFGSNDKLESLANDHAEVDYRMMNAAPAAPAAPAVSGPAHVLTETEYFSLTDRSMLSTGLANITSRLLHQLTSGGEPTPYAGSGNARAVQIDTRGNRVPWDDSPLVTWQRMVAVSAGGSMLALVSLPVSTQAH